LLDNRRQLTDSTPASLWRNNLDLVLETGLQETPVSFLKNEVIHIGYGMQVFSLEVFSGSRTWTTLRAIRVDGFRAYRDHQGFYIVFTGVSPKAPEPYRQTVITRDTAPIAPW